MRAVGPSSRRAARPTARDTRSAATVQRGARKRIESERRCCGGRDESRAISGRRARHLSRASSASPFEWRKWLESSRAARFRVHKSRRSIVRNPAMWPRLGAENKLAPKCQVRLAKKRPDARLVAAERVRGPNSRQRSQHNSTHHSRTHERSVLINPLVVEPAPRMWRPHVANVSRTRVRIASERVERHFRPAINVSAPAGRART